MMPRQFAIVCKPKDDAALVDRSKMDLVVVVAQVAAALVVAVLVVALLVVEALVVEALDVVRGPVVLAERIALVA